MPIKEIKKKQKAARSRVLGCAVITCGLFFTTATTTLAEPVNILNFIPAILAGIEKEPPPPPPPLSESVQVLGNYTSFMKAPYSSANYQNIEITGEVFNNTREIAYLTKITAVFRNNSGHIIDTAYSYMPLDRLKPGEKSCFRIYTDAPANLYSFSLDNPSFLTKKTAKNNLRVVESNGVYDSESKEYKILGMINNPSSSTITHTGTIATVYDSNQNVIGCGNGSAYYSMRPGENTSFEINFSFRDFYYAAPYRVQTEEPQ